MSKSKMFKLLEQVNELVPALYRRVSTDRQADEGYSLDVQLEKLQAYAQTLSNVKEVRTYTDDGYSGSSLERPGMKQLGSVHISTSTMRAKKTKAKKIISSLS